MSVYGVRDGRFTARKLRVHNKIPVTYDIPAAAKTATSYIKDAWDVSTTDALTNMGYAKQPPYPVVLMTHAVAAGSAGHTDRVLIKGYDAKGDYIEEYVAVAGTAKSNVYSNNAFGKITSMSCVNTAGIPCKSTDINIGIEATKIGLPYPLASSADIISYTVNSACATTAPYSINKTYNVLTDATNLTAGKSVKIIYKSRLQ